MNQNLKAFIQENVTNFDEYKSTATHWIALYLNGENAIYFVSFKVEQIPKEMKIHRKFLGIYS